MQFVATRQRGCGAFAAGHGDEHASGEAGSERENGERLVSVRYGSDGAQVSGHASGWGSAYCAGCYRALGGRICGGCASVQGESAVRCAAGKYVVIAYGSCGQIYGGEAAGLRRVIQDVPSIANHRIESGEQIDVDCAA